MVALLSIDHTEQMKRARMGRRDRQNLPVRDRGAIEVAGAMALDGGPESLRGLARGRQCERRYFCTGIVWALLSVDEPVFPCVRSTTLPMLTTSGRSYFSTD